MAYKIVIKKKFIASLSDILSYLEKEWSIQVADDFVKKVDLRISALQNHPFIGALTRFKTIRGVHITKHNRMYYRVTKNKVTILNMYDTRRKTYS